MSTDEVRDIARAVVAARPEWELGEVLTVLVRVLNSRPVDVEALRRAAMHVAGQPGARTPWALLGSGGQWSRSAGRDVVPAAVHPAGYVPEPDPYRGDENRRSATYRAGAASARARLGDAAAAREVALKAKQAADDEARARRVLADAERAVLHNPEPAPMPEPVDTFGGDEPW